MNDDNIVHLNDTVPVYLPEEPTETRWLRLRSFMAGFMEGAFKAVWRLGLAYLILCGVAFNLILLFDHYATN